MPSSSSSSSVPAEITGLPTEIVTGYTIPESSSTLGWAVTVEVNPPDFASSITHEFEGEERADIEDWTYDDTSGEITFKVKGLPPGTPSDEPEGDTTLKLMCEGEVLACAVVIVVIPKSIGSVNHTTATKLPVAAMNRCLNSSTVPAWYSVLAPDYYMVTTWGTSITVPVVDQFGEPLAEIYNGQFVYEDGWDINVQIDGGEYEDRIGIYQPRFGGGETNPDNITSSTSPWESAEVPERRPDTSGVETDIYSIVIGGHTLVKGIENRSFGLYTDDTEMGIDWQQDPPE